MKNKMDSYFKKNLDVPQQPPADAWEYIQNRIPQKQKKRILPLWVKLSGIAALLLMMISGGYMSGLFESESDQNSVSNPENSSVSYRNSSEIENQYNQFDNEDQNWNETENSIQYPIDGQPKTFSYEHHSNSQNSNNTNNSNFLLTNSNHYSDNSIFYNSSENPHSDNSSSTLPTQNQNEINNLNNSPQIAWNAPVWDPEILILKNSNPAFDPLNSSELEKSEHEKNSLLASNSKENKKKKFKNEFKKKPEFDRFYLSGFISPMALNSFVGNSMLSDEMSEYKTENNVTLAYGVKGAYALSPRVKVRTGVSVIGFEQITKNVGLSASVDNGSAVSLLDQQNNVKYHGDLRIENHYAASLSGGELNNHTLTGNIQQQSQYIEIPVEAEVALFQTNSIGISATAGGSTWLLSKNKIYAHTDDYTEELGKADNLNNTSFSANAGLKFDMKISENVQINVEPGFKYLINPVNDIERYNPYTVGVNAGITVSLK